MQARKLDIDIRYGRRIPILDARPRPEEPRWPRPARILFAVAAAAACWALPLLVARLLIS